MMGGVFEWFLGFAMPIEIVYCLFTTIPCHYSSTTMLHHYKQLFVLKLFLHTMCESFLSWSSAGFLQITLVLTKCLAKKKNLYTFTHFRDRNEWKRRDLKFSFRTFTPPSFHVLLLSLPTYGFL